MISRPSSSLAVMIDSCASFSIRSQASTSSPLTRPAIQAFADLDQCPAQHPWGLQRGRNGVGCHQEEL